jgi:hypothetical protein
MLLLDLIDPVPPCRRWRLVHLRRTAAGQGGKGHPLGNPWPWRMPTVEKAPRCGCLFTGREPHAIPGVTLPFAVILTAHRLRSSLHSARQTAWSLGVKGPRAEAKSEKRPEVGRVNQMQLPNADRVASRLASCLLNKNLGKHELSQSSPFHPITGCDSLQLTKAQGGCWH